MRRVQVFNLKQWAKGSPRCFGLFHGWGIDSEEVDGGVLTYTVGIIELDDGEIELVPVKLFVFVKEGSQ